MDQHQEVIGDAGGTSYGVGFGTLTGPGLPTARGGWPLAGANGFAPDPSFGNALGISGYHQSFLELSERAEVTFQYMGRGDASQSNRFFLDLNRDGDYADPGEELFRGGVTTACSMQGGVVPVCDGGNQFTFTLDPGRILFAYLTEPGALLQNSGAGLGNPDPRGQLPGYFLGADPYCAQGPFQKSCKSVYAGLTDRPAPGDHDFQDLGVRISVAAAPTVLWLALPAWLALALTRRRSRSV